MKCENCGYEYDDILNYCPYCDTENSKKVMAEEHGKLDAKQKLTNWIRRAPDEVGYHRARPVVRILLLLAGVALAAAILILAIHSVYTFVTSTTAQKRQEKRIDKLESLYQEGDYLALEKQLLKYDDYYSNTYQKYYIAYRVAGDNLIWRLESVVSNYEFSQSIVLKAEDIAYSLSYVYDVLSEIRESEENYYAFDEEKCCEYAKKQITDTLKQYYLLTDEEIEEGLSIYINLKEQKPEQRAKGLEKIAQYVVSRWTWMK